MRRPRLALVGLWVLVAGNLVMWGYQFFVRPVLLAREAAAMRRVALAAGDRDGHAALALWSQVVSLEQAAWGERDPRLLDALHRATLLGASAVADYAAGERYGLQAVEIAPPGSFERLSALEDLAFVYICTARFNDAEPLLEEARTLLDRPDVPATLEHEYWVRRIDMALKQFQPARAERICREALARPPVHANPGRQADLTCWLGTALLRQNKSVAATRAYRSALQASTHMPQTRELCREGLIRSLARDGRIDEAEQVFAEMGQSASPSLLEALAQAHRDIGKLAVAEKEYRTALDRRLRMQGRGHVSVGTTEVYLADVLLDEEQFDEALRYYTEAIEICRRGVDAEHPHVAQALVGLGRLYLERHQYAQARQTCNRRPACWKSASAMTPDRSTSSMS